MENIIKLLEKTQKASREVALLDNDAKNEFLRHLSTNLIENEDVIIESNRLDILKAQINKMPKSFIDRLMLTPQRIKDMADGLLALTNLADPTNVVLSQFKTEDGLSIQKITVPFGVISIIYEARPNVTIDGIGLVFKAGSSVFLRGSKDAISSNLCLVNIAKQTLKHLGINENAVNLLEDTSREASNFLMKQKKYVDLLIPRGGQGLINSVVENSLIPIIETGTGNCHIYVHNDADLNMALGILKNGKLQRVSVCNALESMVVDEEIAKEFLSLAIPALKESNVEIFGCDKAKILFPDLTLATADDFYKEYTDYKISVKIVKNESEAIAHINEHSTKHSETIITENLEVAKSFLKQIDSSCVYHNASTRFTDGFMFGFGAEIGISTQKLHARGPMGLNEIVSYKYAISGEGQTRK